MLFLHLKLSFSHLAATRHNEWKKSSITFLSPEHSCFCLCYLLALLLFKSLTTTMFYQVKYNPIKKKRSWEGSLHEFLPTSPSLDVFPLCSRRFTLISLISPSLSEFSSLNISSVITSAYSNLSRCTHTYVSTRIQVENTSPSPSLLDLISCVMHLSGRMHGGNNKCVVLPTLCVLKGEAQSSFQRCSKAARKINTELWSNFKFGHHSLLVPLVKIVSVV